MHCCSLSTSLAIAEKCSRLYTSHAFASLASVHSSPGSEQAKHRS